MSRRDTPEPNVPLRPNRRRHPTHSPGGFAWGLAMVKLGVLVLGGCMAPRYGPAGLSCPLERVPSGHRRPQKTGVCASPPLDRKRFEPFQPAAEMRTLGPNAVQANFQHSKSAEKGLFIPGNEVFNPLGGMLIGRIVDVLRG